MRRKFCTSIGTDDAMSFSCPRRFGVGRCGTKTSNTHLRYGEKLE